MTSASIGPKRLWRPERSFLSVLSLSLVSSLCPLGVRFAFFVFSDMHCSYTARRTMCRATYLRLQITLVPARWFKTLTRDCKLSNAFITFYIYISLHTWHTLHSSRPLYVYSLNLYARTRQDILYHWHISWDYTIIIFLSQLSHGLFFPILFARSRSVDELRHLWLNIRATPNPNT